MPFPRRSLVHTPVTPFDQEGRVDFDAFARLIAFHLEHGAKALAPAMHVGESVSLTDAEQRALITFVVKEVGGRVPVFAHVSDSGTGIAAARASHAAAAGAAAIVATTPYYWTPPVAMVLEHFVQIGSAADIPFFVFHAPQDMGGARLTADLVLKLAERLRQFAGVIDTSLDWQFMVNVMSHAQRASRALQLVSGTEYMISAGAIGATGMFSSLAGVAPRLVRRLHDLCCEERYADARVPQEHVAALRQAVKEAGPAGLKAALRVMGRDCGGPRPPLDPLRVHDEERLAARLAAIPPLQDEPRGWQTR
jgi:4-hydroxy-tetrahydrodipicolinate synthase